MESNHKIEESRLLEWWKEAKLLYAQDGNKQLFCTLDARYLIYQNGELIHRVFLQSHAVELYNSL